MKIIRDDLWLCVDCLLAAANGDFSALDYHHGDGAEERQAEITAGLDALGPGLVPDFDSECGDGIDEFRRHGCDCCGSPLGGELHRFAVLGDE